MNIFDSSLTDEELAVLVQKGDGEKFGVLMSRYEKKLLRYGRNFLSEPENIEDIVHDVFMKTYENMKSFDASQRFSPWIYRIAHNCFVNGLKKGIRNPLRFFEFDTLIPHPVYEDPGDPEKDQKEMRALIDKGLEKLAPKYREVIVLHYFEELGYKEISEVLQIPTGTVGVRLRRAKESLKKVYEKLNINYAE